MLVPAGITVSIIEKLLPSITQSLDPTINIHCKVGKLALPSFAVVFTLFLENVTLVHSLILIGFTVFTPIIKYV